MDEVRAKKTIAKNTAALLALRVLLPAFSVVLVMFVARALGTEGLGRYTLAYTFLYVFSTLAPLGISAILTRDGARDPDRLGRLLGSGLEIGVVSGVIVTVLMWSVIGVMGYDRETLLALVAVSFVVLPATLGVQLEGAASAMERMEFITLAALIESAIKTVGGIGLLLAGYGINAVLLAAFVARAAGAVVLFVALRRAGLKVLWAPHLDTFRYLFSRAPTFLAITIFATLYWRIDVLMLSKMGSIEDVGFYGAAWRLLELGMVVPQSVCHAVYPQLANSALGDLPRFLRLGRATMRNLMAISLPMAVCMSIMAEPVLEFIYGSEFVVAAPTLIVLIWTVVPYGWVRYNAMVLVAAEHQSADLWLNASMTLLNVALNLYLIPTYGYFGAAVATTVSIVAYGAAQWGYLRARLPKHQTELVLPAGPLVAAICAGMGAWLLRDVHVVAALAVSALLYGGALLLTGFVSIAELRVVLSSETVER